jgi:predicted DNA-binding protein (MmcQ/YjbR family)
MKITHLERNGRSFGTVLRAEVLRLFMSGMDSCASTSNNPLDADFFRQIYNDVSPAYHMNKTHWNTVMLSGDVPGEELHRMIERSYNLIKPKIKGR